MCIYIYIYIHIICAYICIHHGYNNNNASRSWRSATMAIVSTTAITAIVSGGFES